MKMIFKIAKNELRSLFYSPVAWFLTIAFFVQCAVYYTSALAPYAKWQELMLSNNPKFKDFGLSFTLTLFLYPNGLFENVSNNLYLFIPLLTMGLISREINNGTIKLIYSSPVKVIQIVFGKYLSILLYNLLLVAIVAVFMITAAFNVYHIDGGLLLSALLGFYLLVCAYTAIGLFMSSLTTYPIVSAIGSFLIIFILSHIGTLWQQYDFVRDLTYFLSISGRTRKMLQGLITTKDVLYFVVIVYIFLGFTIIKIRAGRESKPWFVKAARYLAVFVSALFVGYITSRPALTGYLDTTALKTNTLHPNTQKIVKELGDDPLEVTLYTNLMGPGLKNALPDQRNNYLSVLWDRFLRFKPNIKFNYVYYYDVKKGDNSIYKSFPNKSLKQIAEKMAEGNDEDASLFESPEEIRKQVNLEQENYRVVMQLKYKGKITFLRTFNDALFWPIETQVAAALKRLLPEKLPKILYINGDLERNIYKSGEREFMIHSIEKLFRPSLINQGFDCDTISLATQDIPKDITALVLGDPKTKLSEASLNKIKQYIAQGGNMMILGEPGKQDIVNPVLENLGVKMLPGNLVQPTEFEMPQMIRPYLTEAGANLSDDNMLVGLREAMKAKDNDADTMKIMIPGATALAYDSAKAFTIKPLLMTNGKDGWLKQGVMVTDSAQIIFTPQEGDTKGSYPEMLQLTRNVSGKEQRIIVGGDADFMSNLRGGGEFFATSLFSWLDDNKYPIYTPRPNSKDRKLSIGASGAKAETIIYVWLIPCMILVLGTVLLIRRKRK